jgi:branched-chain amino acid transport system ATP-binding protein
MSVISIEQLHAGYGKNKILHGVNFAAANKITGIIGANGSGKSTLLKSIFGIADIFDGTIKYNDSAITGMPSHTMMSNHISYMSQTNNVFSELSIKENLSIAKADHASTFDLFPVLENYLDKKANQLSGGQRQMLALAMILGTLPKVILLDEPTANLSPKNAKLILEKIKEIQAKLKCCVILVEQNITQTLEICDTVYLFSSGQVKYSGTPKEMMQDISLVKNYLGV